MDKYKEFFYKSQAGMADAIENLEEILYELKVCMIECEEQVISDKRTQALLSIVMFIHQCR